MATEKNNIGVIHQDGCVEIMKQDGPGIWFGFHVTSLETRDISTQLNTIRNIKLMLNKLRCLKCRGHAQEYIKLDPPELSKYRLFEWTIDFHNSVNERLGKELWNYNKARKFYSNPPTIKEGEGCKMIY